jgi:hypothetical protein
MFRIENYDKLNSLWDGKLSNGETVCGACKGMCCHNTDKILFPGEYEYLVKKTGQMNSSWRSVGCLCYELGKIKPKLGKFKPVICKLFPLEFEMTLGGSIKLLMEIPASDYTDNCSKLIISKEDRPKIQRWLNYLFSDVHNRFYYLHQLRAPNLIDDEKEILQAMGKNPDDFTESELEERALFKAMGLPIKDHLSHFDFNLEK